MAQDVGAALRDHVEILNAGAGSRIVMVCEHASLHIPADYGGLGLSAAARDSHAAWDPGAMAVARGVAERLDAVLVAAGVSRLVYDCNRPPEAADAMPARSEIYDIPANAALDEAGRAHRVQEIYVPFRAAVAREMARRVAPALVTVHSFTPVYNGLRRQVEIGVLHDRDARLADALLAAAGRYLEADVQRNQPYGPKDGVTHTLKEHAVGRGHLNVMLEIRNDLIATGPDQDQMAGRIAAWIADGIASAVAMEAG